MGAAEQGGVMRFRRRAGKRGHTEQETLWAVVPETGPVRFDSTVHTAGELMAAADEERDRPPSGGRAA